MHYKYKSSSRGQNQHAFAERTSQIEKKGQDVMRNK